MRARFRRWGKAAAALAALYALADLVYLAKSAAGLDLLPGHYGGWFLGSQRLVPGARRAAPHAGGIPDRHAPGQAPR